MTGVQRRRGDPIPRLTPQRRAVLEVLRAAKDHPDVAEVYQRARKRMPRLGFATVYRALSYLKQYGLVQELQQGPVNRYDANVHRHGHITCLQCGRVGDVEVEVPQAVLARAKKASGYRVQDYRLALYGMCPRCVDGQEQAERATTRGEKALK